MTLVANCTQCNRIFKRQHSPMCPECHQVYMAKLSNVYRFVQENPHLTLEDIAEQCDLPLREVEALFFQGKLGTATTQIIYHCQLCNRPMASNMLKGRFCVSCAEQFETEAKLHEVETFDKPRSKTTKPSVKEVVAAEETGEKPALSPSAKNEEPVESSTESHGFKRLSSESL